jgi:hypothetical protein
MKKNLLLRSAVAGFVAISATLRLAAQSPTPTSTPFTPCPVQGWSENLVNFIGPTAPFPTNDTKNNPSSDCAFHQWAWEAFIWATALDTSGQPRFLDLPNLDGLDNPKLAVKGPKPLVLKPRTVKPRGSQQDVDEFQQAGPQGVLVDQNGQALWYSQHANDIYFEFVKKYYGVTNYAKASATLEFPLGAAVFKASWQIVPEGTKPQGFFTTAATVPILKNNPKGGIMIDTTAKPRAVTVALVGLHVVGITVNHPEFLWGTFEQIQNAPDLTSASPVSTKDFTFYKAGTVAADCNLNPSAPHANPPLSVSDPTAQTLTPITNVYRQFAWGGESKAGVQEIEGCNSQAQSAVTQFPKNPTEAIWANYKLIGTVWEKPNTLVPGDGTMDTQAVGSVTLANATLETFVQGATTNCFSCHNTSANAEHKIAAKDINLSHKILEPFFTDPAIKKNISVKPVPATAP